MNEETMHEQETDGEKKVSDKNSKLALSPDKKSC